ncbi:MAG: NAD(P)H-dependent oxidoreductase subunit E [Planctomycetales bacterium]|nr:NAD(P)H-dependent oxidoreductase subunit E [Planctomycetales bacterium]NIM09116.1 NAD(P)H-dependent oxidoreductase subunit E [Planctomycetales bacterium]NIN08587.1 NAD(P)H-dependent oxidoreductase subunit E [Planctomycetales bacterium]NIN77709.1 NAD(P)H-dependent oxidoreductase subunit E [Planctomycetales bacterium]NIO34885.1 NAD(P)H-dependent oxidoreductase subunit E [Planctomycetales bacterium]
MATEQPVLTEQMIGEIKSYFPRYPTRQAVTLPALHVVNRHLRHVPHAAVVEIAKLLELAPAEIQDTLTFYQFFKQDAPHGQTRAWVCRSLSCALRGGEEVLDHLCERVGIRAGGTTADGRLTIEAAECLGVCDHAPCLLAGEEVHGDLDRDKADEFLRKCGVELEKETIVE